MVLLYTSAINNPAIDVSLKNCSGVYNQAIHKFNLLYAIGKIGPAFFFHRENLYSKNFLFNCSSF